jgi:uncharacterized protein YbjT (DUF2867 family)
MNNNKPVILITGATGNTGAAVVRHMIRSAPKDYIIRAASHDEAKLKRLFGKETNLELIRMDFKDKTSIRAALKNVERVWVTAPRPEKTMKQGDRMRWVNDFVDECKQIGSIKLIVFGSSYGADNDTTILGKEFRIGEKKIEQSGISYCFLRLGPMIDLILSMKDEILNQGVYPAIDGTARLCPLWSDDVGRVASTVLANPDKFKNKSYLLTGPEPLTVDEQGKLLSKVLGRQLIQKKVDRKEYINILKKVSPEYMAEGVVEWIELARNGTFATPSPDTKTVTGFGATRYEEAVKNMQSMGLLQMTSA